ncbi:hypothetical protein Pcinc_008818 [Petrolisthes cinctipes]|uniref:Uncharacterized protein n=1 Tax=Petrolisthes cinctipes TaxID=88211 RepID=A0AAE1G5U0_PETCI|nr:hypothetical protein Pcinc_008818 [Petrolisthes cinctipes]
MSQSVLPDEESTAPPRCFICSELYPPYTTLSRTPPFSPPTTHLSRCHACFAHTDKPQTPTLQAIGALAATAKLQARAFDALAATSLHQAPLTEPRLKLALPSPRRRPLTSSRYHHASRAALRTTRHRYHASRTPDPTATHASLHLSCATDSTTSLVPSHQHTATHASQQLSRTNDATPCKPSRHHTPPQYAPAPASLRHAHATNESTTLEPPHHQAPSHTRPHPPLDAAHVPPTL